jgi:hypothetical protein
VRFRSRRVCVEWRAGRICRSESRGGAAWSRGSPIMPDRGAVLVARVSWRKSIRLRQGRRDSAHTMFDVAGLANPRLLRQSLESDVGVASHGFATVLENCPASGNVGWHADPIVIRGSLPRINARSPADGRSADRRIASRSGALGRGARSPVSTTEVTLAAADCMGRASASPRPGRVGIACRAAHANTFAPGPRSAGARTSVGGVSQFRAGSTARRRAQRPFRGRCSW